MKLKYQKITLILLSLLMLASVALTGCGFVSGSTASKDKITIWASTFWGGNNDQFLEYITNKWNAGREDPNSPSYHKEELTYAIQQNMVGVLQTGTISGEVADIVIWDRWETIRYAKLSMFIDVNPYLSAAGRDVDDFLWEPTKEMIYEDKLFGIPLDVDVHGLYVNRGQYLEWAIAVDTGVFPTADFNAQSYFDLLKQEYLRDANGNSPSGSANASEKEQLLSSIREWLIVDSSVNIPKKGESGVYYNTDSAGNIIAETAENEATVDQIGSRYMLPDTWDRYFVAVQGCTRRKGNVITRAGCGVNDPIMTTWNRTAGGDVLTADGQDVQYTKDTPIPGDADGRTYEDAARDALMFWDKLYGNTNTGRLNGSIAATSHDFASSSVDLFLTSNITFFPESILNRASYYKVYSPDDFRWDFMPLPAGPSINSVRPVYHDASQKILKGSGGNTGNDPKEGETYFKNENTAGTYKSSLMGGYGLCIPRQSKKQDSAWEIIQWWLLNDDTYNEWCETTGFMPAKKSVVTKIIDEGKLVAEKPYLKRALAEISTFKVRPPFVNYTIFESDCNNPAIDQYLRRSTKNGSDFARNGYTYDVLSFFDTTMSRVDTNAKGYLTL